MSEAMTNAFSPDLALEDGQVVAWNEEFGRRVVVRDEDVRNFGFTGSFPCYERTEVVHPQESRWRSVMFDVIGELRSVWAEVSPRLEENPGEVARLVAVLLEVSWRERAGGLEYVLSVLRGRRGAGHVELGALVKWALEGWPTLLGVARDVEIGVLSTFLVKWVECVASAPRESPMLCVEGLQVQLNAFAADEDEHGNMFGWQVVCFVAAPIGAESPHEATVREDHWVVLMLDGQEHHIPTGAPLV